MNIKKLAGIAITSLALNSLILTDVLADSVETKCKVRTDRSKISVDAEGLLKGSYYAEVTSGDQTVSSKLTDIQVVSSSGDEVEFDFDSNPNDISEGATAIAPDFIKDRTVLGAIFKTTDNGATGTLVEDDRSKCQVKKRRGRHHGGHDDGPNHK